MDGNVLLTVLLVLLALVALPAALAILSYTTFVMLRFAGLLVYLVPPWKEPYHRWFDDLQKKPFWNQVAVYITIGLAVGVVGFLIELIWPGWAG